MAWRDFVTELGKGPRIENKVSLGNIITILTGIIALIGTVATLQGDIKALAQRVDAGDKRDEKTGDTLDSLKRDVIELKSDSKASRTEQERQGRQLERIEQILRAQPGQPTRGTP